MSANGNNFATGVERTPVSLLAELHVWKTSVFAPRERRGNNGKSRTVAFNVLDLEYLSLKICEPPW